MNDNGTIRGIDVLARLLGRHLVRCRKLAAAYVVGCTLALAVVTPVQAEWEAVDRQTLEFFHADFNTLGSAILNQVSNAEDVLDNDIYPALQALLGHTDGIEQLLTDINTTNQLIGAIVWNIELGVVPKIQEVLDLMNDDPPTNASDPTFITPGAGTLGNVTFTEPTLTPHTDQGQPTFSQSALLFGSKPAPTDPTIGDPITFNAETRTGLQQFTVSVPTGQLGNFFGISGNDITLTTDLSWYDGTPRTAVHAGITAFVVFSLAWLIFEEFRRYA